MVFEFKFPDIGEGITKGTIVKWAVKPGDKVKEDDPLAQVETDKAVADIPSPKTGTIDKIMIPEGKDVAVGQTLVTIQVEGEESAPVSSKSTAAPSDTYQSSSIQQTESQKEKMSSTEHANAEKKDSGTGAVGELEESEKVTNLFAPQSKPSASAQAANSPQIIHPTANPQIQSTTSQSNGLKGLAMPGVRHAAKQSGMDISKIQGTGGHGQVTNADIQTIQPQSNTAITTPTQQTTAIKITTPSGDAIEITGSIREIKFLRSGTVSIQPPTPENATTTTETQKEPISKSTTIQKPEGLTIKRKYDEYGYIERKPFTHLRKLIATNMRKSVDTAAHVTAMDEIDVTELWRLRETEAKKAEKKKIKLTFLPYINRACIHALRKVPALNSHLDEESEEIILKKYYNIGQAVATKDGLKVVVIKRTENKTLYLIAKDIEELAQKARDKTIDISDLKGSSFTITNWGSIGGSYGTPIINPGESAILGVGRIRPVPYLIGKKVEPRYLLPVSLTFDHRVTDGAEAATFLQELKAQLENPKGLTDKEFMKGLKKEEIFDI